MWRLNHMLLNNQRVKEEINRKIKPYLDSSEKKKKLQLWMQQKESKDRSLEQ